MKLKIVLILLFSLNSFASDPTEDEIHKLQQLQSPYISGDTLYINGRIDSHIYDYLSYEIKKVKKVKKVVLNSLGGNLSWALEIAQKISQLQVATVLKKGNFCASACVYLFAAGYHRVAEVNTWFGVHAAHMGVQDMTFFWGLCFIDMEDGPLFEENKKGCKTFMAEAYERALTSTNEAFKFMESQGILPKMRTIYFDMPEDHTWKESGNILRTANWYLFSEAAVEFNLVTKLINNF